MKSYSTGINSSGKEEIVMVGECTFEEHSGYFWHDITGKDGISLTDVFFEHLPQGKKVKVVVTLID